MLPALSLAQSSSPAIHSGIPPILPQLDSHTPPCLLPEPTAASDIRSSPLRNHIQGIQRRAQTHRAPTSCRPSSLLDRIRATEQRTILRPYYDRHWPAPLSPTRATPPPHPSFFSLLAGNSKSTNQHAPQEQGQEKQPMATASHKKPLPLLSHPSSSARASTMS